MLTGALGQAVVMVGLGRALSVVVDQAERHGVDQASALGALVDVLRSYADHCGLTVDEVVALVRDWRPAAEKG